MSGDLDEPTFSPDEVKAKVNAIRAEQQAEFDPKDVEGRGVAGRMVTDFVSAVAVGTGIGWWLDKQFDTSPLWLVILMILGMFGGFVNMVRTFNRSSS